MMFGKQTLTTPGSVNQNRGFHGWRHLQPRISDYENSTKHRKNSLCWREFEFRLSGGKKVDDNMQKAMQSEKEKWRNILKIICDVVLVCGQNNLPLQETKEVIGEPKCGVFLNVIDLISRHNPELKAHLECHEKRGCFLSFSADSEQVH